MTPMNESVLKTDQIGRLRYTSEQKKTMVDAYRASGLSAPRFAAHHGVKYQTLISWIKKEKQRKRGPKHHMKILVQVFYRRHILATYDTYE
jgi:transposase-like protein